MYSCMQLSIINDLCDFDSGMIVVWIEYFGYCSSGMSLEFTQNDVKNKKYPMISSSAV